MLIAQFAYSIALYVLSSRQVGKPLPKAVEGIYNAEEYGKWRSYNNKCDKLGIFSGVLTLAINIVLYCTDVISYVYYLLPGGEAAKAILFFLIMGACEIIISLPIDIIRNFKIEAEFGFNKTTPKTFALDIVKNLILGTAINFLIFMLVFSAYLLLDAYFGFIAFLGIAVVVFIFSSLSTTISKLFNKFTPLEEGELRTNLKEMFEDAGYKLKDIYVMDASKRTTKANAYCGGIGKFKQIVLFDNLVKNYSPEEITAVFAHELAHFKNRDTMKMTLINMLNFLPLLALMSIMMLFPEIQASYGFAEPSVLFAFYLSFGGVVSIINSLIAIPLNAYTRKMERRADTFAAEKGYGDALISGLRKLHKDSLSDMNPHPTVVKLTYSHPPLHERIELAEAKKKSDNTEN